jgi:hypothetical protein
VGPGGIIRASNGDAVADCDYPQLAYLQGAGSNKAGGFNGL